MLVRTLLSVLFLFCGSLAAHEGHEGHDPAGPTLQVEQAWARALPPNAPAAAVYLTVNNPGAADRLLSVRTPIAARAEMHATRKDGELLKMEREESVEIPAKGTVAFVPGGRHIMLMGLQQPLVAGTRFDLTLVFEHAGERDVRVDIRDQAPGAVPAHGQAGHDHAMHH